MVMPGLLVTSGRHGSPGRRRSRVTQSAQVGVCGRESGAPDRRRGETPHAGLTFRKSFRILPGVRLNINRHSWSITTGGGARPAAHAQQHGTSYDIDGFARTFRVASHPYRQAHGLTQAVTRTAHLTCAISYLR